MDLMEKKEVKESKVSILLIDDDPSVIFYHRALLEYRLTETHIRSFNEVSTAIQFLEQNPPLDSFTLILLDLNMPVKNGWDFLSKAEKLKNTSQLHIVIVSSSINEADKMRAKEHILVKGFFEKPLEDKDFNCILSALPIQENPL